MKTVKVIRRNPAGVALEIEVRLSGRGDRRTDQALQVLLGGSRKTGAVAAELGVSMSNASKVLARLRSWGLAGCAHEWGPCGRGHAPYRELNWWILPAGRKRAEARRT